MTDQQSNIKILVFDFSNIPFRRPASSLYIVILGSKSFVLSVTILYALKNTGNFMWLKCTKVYGKFKVPYSSFMICEACRNTLLFFVLSSYFSAKKMIFEILHLNANTVQLKSTMSSALYISTQVVAE